MWRVYNWSDFPPGPLYGSNWGHKIADFVFLPYIAFIITFANLWFNNLTISIHFSGDILHLKQLFLQTIAFINLTFHNL